MYIVLTSNCMTERSDMARSRVVTECSPAPFWNTMAPDPAKMVSCLKEGKRYIGVTGKRGLSDMVPLKISGMKQVENYMFNPRLKKTILWILYIV